MIKQVIVVEGKSDIARVSMAVDADMIATEGFTLRPEVIERIRLAYEKRGIIILTDPDGPGERIRKRLIKLFPKALNAFVPKMKHPQRMMWESRMLLLNRSGKHCTNSVSAVWKTPACSQKKTYLRADLSEKPILQQKGKQLVLFLV